MEYLASDSESEEVDLQEDETMVKLCEVCNQLPKQYKCPKCSLTTCSLKCCKLHKVESGCTGKRDRSSYLPINDFKENHLRNDFHLLEDILQSKISAKSALDQTGGQWSKHAIIKHKHAPKNEPFFNNKHHLDSHSVRTRKFVKAAYHRGTTVLAMPAGMGRHTLNTSKFVPKINKIYWRVNIVFITGDDILPATLLNPNLDSSTKREHIIPINPTTCLVGVTSPNVDEDKVLGELVMSYLEDSHPDNAVLRHMLRPLRLQPKVNKIITKPTNDIPPLMNSNDTCFSKENDNNIMNNENNNNYVDDNNNNNDNISQVTNTNLVNEVHDTQFTSISHLKCVLQRIPSNATDPMFSEIPLHFSLRDALKEKTVIEYPTFFILTMEAMMKLKLFIMEALPANSHPSENGGNESKVNQKIIENFNNGSHSNKNEINNGKLARVFEEVLQDMNATTNKNSQPNKRQKVTNITNSSLPHKMIETITTSNTAKEPLEDTIEREHEEDDGNQLHEAVSDDDDENEEIEDDIVVDGDERESFLSALKEFENQDLESLQALIRESELEME